jgi:hypothetical protein
VAEKIFEVEHEPGEWLVIRLRPLRFGAVSKPTREHILAAHKEMLMALRSVVDVAIEHVDEAGKKKGGTRTKIEVE